METTFDFYQYLKNDNLSFIYQGEFNDNITDRILSLTESNIDNVSELRKLKKKVSSIMVESFQNIVRHQDGPIEENRMDQSGVFLIRNIGDTFYITSTNLIENTKIDLLKSALIKVNSLDRDELKDFYLEILSNEELSGKGGAGLGLIEMARKSGQRLEFDFDKVSDRFSFFYLQIKLQKKELLSSEGTKKSVHKDLSLDVSKEIHKTMRSNNVLLIYKGDFAQNSIKPILRMIEENIERQDEEFSVKKKVFLVLVEILQNISKHSSSLNSDEVYKEGIFLIGKKDDQYYISSGNLIENKKIDSLKNHLNKLNGLDKDSLKGLHKKILKESKISTKGGAGLGLVFIARKSSEKIRFDFISIDDKSSFFSLKVQI